jgi:hypothetical protein
LHVEVMVWIPNGGDAEQITSEALREHGRSLRRRSQQPVCSGVSVTFWGTGTMKSSRTIIRMMIHSVVLRGMVSPSLQTHLTHGTPSPLRHSISHSVIPAPRGLPRWSRSLQGGSLPMDTTTSPGCRYEAGQHSA